MQHRIVYTKEELIKHLEQISDMGWVPNSRHGNDGGIGNTLEDLLGITENNLSISNTTEWELKAQRLNTTSLITLFHMEPPYPPEISAVPQLLLINYGWPHKKAGIIHPANELSFRQTIHARSRSSRGFKILVAREAKNISISFDAQSVDQRHNSWLESIKSKIGLGELNPQPAWNFDELELKISLKLLNCLYVQARVKMQENRQFYHYCKVTMLQNFNFNGFLDCLEEGNVLIDFDARSGKNHGTKFRLRQNYMPKLYEKSTIIFDR